MRPFGLEQRLSLSKDRTGLMSAPSWLETHFETASWLADTNSDGSTRPTRVVTMKRRPPSVQPPSSRISQAVEKRLRGEHAGIGDFEDALLIGQESHAVFPATPHRIRLQGDETSLRFVIRRRAWVARFPGEPSLSLGTPGLHDESPLGFPIRKIAFQIFPVLSPASAPCFESYALPRLLRWVCRASRNYF